MLRPPARLRALPPAFALPHRPETHQEKVDRQIGEEGRLATEIFELLLIIVRFFREKRQTRTLAPVVFNCPACGEVRIAQEIVRSATGRRGVVSRSAIPTHYFQCRTCHQHFKAESFSINAAGVYQIKTWQCPQCGHINDATRYRCDNCRHSLV